MVRLAYCGRCAWIALVASSRLKSAAATGELHGVNMLWRTAI
jgi:hypothetical protein